jgi:2-oxoglutarate ferredoxin oxidoreductase subunit delta
LEFGKMGQSGRFAFTKRMQVLEFKSSMAGKIKIDVERCKGCTLCVSVCPHKSIVISRKTNKSGYFPVEIANGLCVGCSACAIVCPDAAIVVMRETKITEIKPVQKKSKTIIFEEKL